MKDFIYSASFTGTTALGTSGLHIRCGFVPKHVVIRGRTSSNSIEWFASMPDASKYTSDDTSLYAGFAYADSAGITPIDGTEALAADAYIEGQGSCTVATGRIQKQGFFLAGGCISNTEVYDVFAER